jgi:hypothetical protein
MRIWRTGASSRHRWSRCQRGYWWQHRKLASPMVQPSHKRITAAIQARESVALRKRSDLRIPMRADMAIDQLRVVFS